MRNGLGLMALPLRGRGPRSGEGVYYGTWLKWLESGAGSGLLSAIGYRLPALVGAFWKYRGASMIKPYNRAFARGKTDQPRLWRDGNAPLLPTAPPPEGEVLAALCLEMLMRKMVPRGL